MASLVLGIAAFILGLFVIGGVIGVIGLILGILGISKAKAIAGKGKSMAVAGAILSGLGILFTIGVLVFGIALFSTHKNSINNYIQCIDNARTTAQRDACVQQFGNDLQNP